MQKYEKYLNNKIECIVKIMIVEMILRKWTEWRAPLGILKVQTLEISYLIWLL